MYEYNLSVLKQQYDVGEKIDLTKPKETKKKSVSLVLEEQEEKQEEKLKENKNE